MPCTDGGNQESYESEEVKTLTKYLCEAMQHVPMGNRDGLSLALRKWWKEHQAEDRERVKQEMRQIDDEKKKKAAIKKLTPYERSLLGLG